MEQLLIIPTRTIYIVSGKWNPYLKLQLSVDIETDSADFMQLFEQVVFFSQRL